MKHNAIFKQPFCKTGRVLFAYGKGTATGTLRAREAAEQALANLSPTVDGNLKPHAAMVVVSGSETTLMTKEYGDVVEAIHNFISVDTNFKIDSVINDRLGEQLEVSLVLEYFNPLENGGENGIQAD